MKDCGKSRAFKRNGFYDKSQASFTETNQTLLYRCLSIIVLGRTG